MNVGYGVEGIFLADRLVWDGRDGPVNVAAVVHGASDFVVRLPLSANHSQTALASVDSICTAWTRTPDS